MARILVAHAVRALAWLVTVVIVVQIYFAGAFVFGAIPVDLHRFTGVGLFLAAFVTAVLSLTTRDTRANWKLHWGLFVLMFVQALLVIVRYKFPALAAVSGLHVVNAFVLLVLAHRAARAVRIPVAAPARAPRPSLEVLGPRAA